MMLAYAHLHNNGETDILKKTFDHQKINLPCSKETRMIQIVSLSKISLLPFISLSGAY